jgi:iron complex outermembrane receptor protein
MRNTVVVGDRAAMARRRPTAARVGRVIAAACIALKVTAVVAQDARTGPASPADLSRMSLEDLVNIEISSVLKKPERLSDAAAAVYVITREEIRRSGYASIPEILRLAPNLQVARVDSSSYAITARGFNGTSANKLEVLIDGRSVYTPLNSGVFWDVQDILIEDVERIEVISGPGGTLWGSNAVNGVINIITRSSRETQGTLLGGGAGTAERGAAARYGGKLGRDTTFRLYAKGFDRDSTRTGAGTDLQNSWQQQQVGFRIDSANATDTFTLQGDAYDGSIHQPTLPDKTISGANLLGRWNRVLADDANIQVQAYYDRTQRNYPGASGFGEVLDTYDIDVQHRFRWGKDHDIVWGGGYRLERDHVDNSALLQFLPAQKTLSRANVFVQDSIALGERLKLTLGVKLEHNNYTGLEVQPSARLAWKLDERRLLWSAVSRAVRTPSRVDREFFVPAIPASGFPGFIGGDFTAEKLVAYELGYRAQPSADTSFSVSAFYNVYDDLRSIESSAGAGSALVIANQMKGHTRGVEMWGNYRVSDWWRLSAGYNYLKKDLSLKSGSSDATSLAGSETDPRYQFSLRSTMNLAHNLELDVSLRSIGRLRATNVPRYTALDARLGWQVSKDVEVSLSGFNLLGNRHPEFGALPGRSEFGREIYARVLWKF